MWTSHGGPQGVTSGGNQWRGLVSPPRWRSDRAQGQHGEDGEHDVRGVRLDGGDGVLGHKQRGHLHLEGPVPHEDGQGPRRPRVQHARAGEGEGGARTPGPAHIWRFTFIFRAFSRVGSSSTKSR